MGAHYERWWEGVDHAGQAAGAAAGAFGEADEVGSLAAEAAGSFLLSAGWASFEAIELVGDHVVVAG